jgi:hypothetical protein
MLYLVPTATESDVFFGNKACFQHFHLLLFRLLPVLARAVGTFLLPVRNSYGLSLGRFNLVGP